MVQRGPPRDLIIFRTWLRKYFYAQYFSHFWISARARVEGSSRGLAISDSDICPSSGVVRVDSLDYTVCVSGMNDNSMRTGQNALTFQAARAPPRRADALITLSEVMFVLFPPPSSSSFSHFLAFLAALVCRDLHTAAYALMRWPGKSAGIDTAGNYQCICVKVIDVHTRATHAKLFQHTFLDLFREKINHYLRDSVYSVLYGHTKDRKAYETNTAQNEHGAKRTRRKTNTAQNEHGAKRTRRKTNTAQNEHGAKRTRRKTNTAQNEHGTKRTRRDSVSNSKCGNGQLNGQKLNFVKYFPSDNGKMCVFFNWKLVFGALSNDSDKTVSRERHRLQPT